MALTVTEALAVSAVMQWLAGEGDDDRTSASLDLLADHASKTLQVRIQSIEPREAIARLVAARAAPVPTAIEGQLSIEDAAP